MCVKEGGYLINIEIMIEYNFFFFFLYIVDIFKKIVIIYINIDEDGDLLRNEFMNYLI